MNILAKKLYRHGGVTECQLIEIRHGSIVSVRSHTGQAVEKSFDNLSAGLFDSHINGGYHFHFTEHPAVVTVQDIAKASLATGTAYTLPTLITSSLENMLAGIASVKQFKQENPGGGVVGIHLEGPFISVKKRGAHVEKYVRVPTESEIEYILKAGEGVVRLMTIAPEVFTDKLLRKFSEAGVKLSVGHSNATYVQTKHAFSLGINLVTHLYNAMSGLHHREPGVVGAALEDESVYAPIILDGHHCNAGAAKVAYRAKKDKLFLVSDALFLGQRKATFEWGEFDARLENGTYINSERNLAGGAVSLPDCIRNAVNDVGIPLPEAIAMATERAAAAMGLQNEICRIEAGFPAVFSTFSDDLTNFQVVKFDQVQEPGVVNVKVCGPSTVSCDAIESDQA